MRDDLTVSFDARYQLDHQAAYQGYLSGSPPTFVPGSDANFRTFSPRVIVQYKVDPDYMVYASWSVGNNVGSTNTGLLDLFSTVIPNVANYIEKTYGAGLVVQPETTRQYEVGIKGKFWDNRISLATDIYAGTWTNQIAQINVYYPVSAVQSQSTAVALNIGKTDLFGWEFDGVIKPIEHLVVNGSAGLAQTKLAVYNCQNCLAVNGSANVKGNQLPNYPAWQANVGAEWSDEAPWFEGMNYYFRAEAVYRDKEFVDFTDINWISDSLKENFRAGVRGGDYSLEAFILNAFDDRAYANAQQNVNLLSGNFTALTVPVGLPILRQFGVRLKYIFQEGREAPAQAAAYIPPPVVAPTPALNAARSYMVFFDFNRSDLSSQAVAIVDTAAKNASPKFCLRAGF